MYLIIQDVSICQVKTLSGLNLLYFGSLLLHDNMILFPNAKINIGLNIISRRNDGYHNLETIFYPVEVKDALEVIEAPSLEFTASGITIPGAATDNLCIKAWHLLAKDMKIPTVHIHLHKHIPIGAGLGGGSADAAFFIRLMNEKFNLGLSNDQMQDYARQLGADCAFFILNEPALAFEKGDHFSKIDLDLSAYYLVLVMPPVQVSTDEAYQNVQPKNPDKALSELIQLPVENWRDHIVNDFETSVFKNHPSIRTIKSALYEAGALYASMSGSGSSVYGIFRNEVKLPELEQGNTVFYGV
ncbi:MAG TPA: 4-(cytidine 5'-diphospho)-2-C-methyl-D-erythritol kinase [Daejeonella sp.]|nr:4-(cytidine 5'-diphospho)-2-C-methyl-D-erythritol kinase [Daejeonella sp.]